MKSLHEQVFIKFNQPFVDVYSSLHNLTHFLWLLVKNLALYDRVLSGSSRFVAQSAELNENESKNLGLFILEDFKILCFDYALRVLFFLWFLWLFFTIWEIIFGLNSFEKLGFQLRFLFDPVLINYVDFCFSVYENVQ